MISRRAFDVAATTARLVTGAAVAAACVLGVTFAVASPWPTVRNSPAQTDVTPIPGDSVLVCNGDLRALGRDTSDAGGISSAGAAQLTTFSDSVEPETAELETPDFERRGATTLLTGRVQDRSVPLIAAVESHRVSAADLSGLAVAPCRAPRLESWLVGASTATGAEDLVLIANPGDVPANVTLSVYATVRSSSSLVVPAKTQVAVSVASRAGDTAMPVIRIEAEGAPVRAVLQSSLMRTLDPAGIDLQDAVASAQQRIVIAGVRLFAPEGDGEDLAELRLLSPDADTEVTVRVTDSGTGQPARGDFTVPLVAGEPMEVSLGALADDAYDVLIEAEEPVVAGVHQRDGTALGSDLSWMLPAPELTAELAFAVPAGPDPQLHLVNTSDEDVTVLLARAPTGESSAITVPAGGSAEQALRADSSYRMAPDGPVHASVSMYAPGALAGWPLWPGAGAGQPVTVYP